MTGKTIRAKPLRSGVYWSATPAYKMYEVGEGDPRDGEFAVGVVPLAENSQHLDLDKVWECTPYANPQDGVVRGVFKYFVEEPVRLDVPHSEESDFTGHDFMARLYENYSCASVPVDELAGAVRFDPSWYHDDEDLERAAEAWMALVDHVEDRGYVTGFVTFALAVD